MSTYKELERKVVDITLLKIGDVIEVMGCRWEVIAYPGRHGSVVVLDTRQQKNAQVLDGGAFEVVEGPSLVSESKTFYKASYDPVGSGLPIHCKEIGYTDSEDEARAWVKGKSVFNRDGVVEKVTVYTDGTYFRYVE